MADTSRPLVPSRDSRLTPEAISARDFSQVKRGYSESEVRAYLRMVADELASVGGRERDLANRVRSLEERLSAPKPPPSDQDLITQLGEETARVLGQAREAATELRAKADEHARRVVREAQESARELRTSTQQAVEVKVREAEDAARTRAQEIVGEARTMRERVLTDLSQRRAELERQIAELRANRGRLVETYEVVERALTNAARLMADEPASAPTSASVPPSAPVDVVDAPSAPDADVAEPPGARDDEAVDDANATASVPAVDAPPDEVPPAEAAASTTENASASDTGARDVGALFEKLRSSGAEEPAESVGGAAAEEAADAPVGAIDAPAEPEGAEAERAEAAEGAEAADAETPEEPPLTGDAALLHARDVALAPLADDLARRAKRAVQDEQNDVLDGLRRQRGKIDTTKVLPAVDDQLARWAHVLQPAADQAYAAGAESVGGTRDGTAPSALLGELADSAVTPLRSRLVDSLAAADTRTPADTELAIAQALGARYREWRTQDLDVVLGDALAASYARGVHDTVPAGTKLRWVPAREGKCPDCDDNALEPTTRGESFPTGQAFPPAHPGCRCLLVVDDTTTS
ncbi:MAG: DivIVA domain-containing protein [Acidimicrobiia bacterium]